MLCLKLIVRKKLLVFLLFIIDGKQWTKRHDEMTIDEPYIHTEGQALEYLEDLFTNSDDHIVDLELCATILRRYMPDQVGAVGAS